MKSVFSLTVEKGFSPSQQGRHGSSNSGQIVTLIYSQNPKNRHDSTSRLTLVTPTRLRLLKAP